MMPLFLKLEIIRKFKIFLMILLLIPSLAFSQGFNHTWLLGYYPFQYQKARINFDLTSYSLIQEQRKMGFEGTEGNISDANSNFLMSSNGVWIANGNNDTMMNGTGLNPNAFTGAYPNGLLLPYANLFLPFPGDSSKFILFHHTATFNGLYYPTNEILYTAIDLTLDSGLGGVISKNDTAFQDTLNWGLAACKHANGRDWWIVAQKDTSDIIFKILLTPNGIESISSQQLNVPIAWGNVTQLTFSNDGTKFGYQTYIPNTTTYFVLLFDFDRCTGIFSNPHVIDITDGSLSFGFSFSPNSQFAYASSTQHVFQININTLTVDTVATYDGFSSPFPPFYTTFLFNYLAANGKIYITSGNSTSHLHFINYPDSGGMICDVQQHALDIDSVRHFRAVPNHPNYYLGPVTGSICDSLELSVLEVNHDFRFNIFPNPVTEGYLKIIYLLPQNKAGIFEVFDINGRKVFSQTLPPWSTLQMIKLPELLSGLYNSVITSANERVSRKVAVLNK